MHVMVIIIYKMACIYHKEIKVLAICNYSYLIYVQIILFLW
jgi:hypothetical protein